MAGSSENNVEGKIRNEIGIASASFRMASSGTWMARDLFPIQIGRPPTVQS